MSRKLEIAVLASMGLVLVLSAAAPAAVTLTGPGTIKITDRLVKFTHVGGVKAEGGAGGIGFYRQSLFNVRLTKTPIGHADITCINTGTGSMNCDGTYFLPKGKIMVEGVIGSRLFYELAVVGGTGLYANARGSVTINYLGGPEPGEFLDFSLVV
jgi:hypothetical protein